MNKIVGAIIAVMAISGCVPAYTLQGKRYDSAEKFQQAVDAEAATALASIKPLAAPLTQRKLTFAFPSESALHRENLRRYVEISGREPNEMQAEMNRNLGTSAFKLNKVYFDAVRKKNIYASARFVEMDSMVGSFAPSQDTDTLYYIEAARGSGQWFYESARHGKQIFAFDRSSPSPAAKINAFVDAVQALAVRE